MGGGDRKVKIIRCIFSTLCYIFFKAHLIFQYCKKYSWSTHSSLLFQSGEGGSKFVCTTHFEKLNQGSKAALLSIYQNSGSLSSFPLSFCEEGDLTVLVQKPVRNNVVNFILWHVGFMLNDRLL